jgi:ABC-type nickel/cobalt efflux system permease component RcnA
MTSSNDPLLDFLLQQGSTAAVILTVMWILVKKIFKQYEDRITYLEKASEECARDRKALHDLIHLKDRSMIKHLADRLDRTV